MCNQSTIEFFYLYFSILLGFCLLCSFNFLHQFFGFKIQYGAQKGAYTKNYQICLL